MAKKNKELQALITLAGKLDPSLERALNAAQREIEQLAKEAGITGGSFGKLEEKAAKHLTGIDKRFEATGKKLQKFGKTMTAAVTAPIIALGTVSVKSYLDFEDSMRKVRGETGATAEDMDKLTEAARKIGKDPKYSAIEAADAIRQIGKAGYETAETLQTLPIIMDAAFAWDTSAEDISTDLLDSAKAIGAGVDEISRYTDQLTRASELAGVDFSDMAGYAQDAGLAIQGLAGGSVEGLGIGVALMKAGMDSSEAGNAVQNLTNDIDKSSEALKKSGIDIRDETGAMRDMTEVIDELYQKSKSDSGFLASAFNDGDVETLKTLFTVIDKDGIDAIRGYEEAIYDSLGATEERVARMEKTGLGGAFDSIMNSADELKMAFGEEIAERAQGFADALSSLADKVSNMPPEYKDFVANTVILAGAVGPGIWFLGSVTKGVGAIAGVVEGVPGLASVAKGSLSGLGAALATPLGATLAIAGTTALAAYAAKQMYDAEVDKDLQSRYGELKLTLDDIDKITAQLDKPYIPAMQKLQDDLGALKTTHGDIVDMYNELSTKNILSSLGVEMTQAELDTLSGDVTTYVQAVQSAIDTESKTLTLSITDIFGKDDPDTQLLVDSFDSYFAPVQKRANDIGSELLKLVFEAAADGDVTPEKLEAINHLESELMDLHKRISLFDSQMKQATIMGKISIGNLSADEIMELNREMEAVTSDKLTKVDEWAATMASVYEMKYRNYQQAKKDFEAGLLSEENFSVIEPFTRSQRDELTGVAKGKAETERNAILQESSLYSSEIMTEAIKVGFGDELSALDEWTKTYDPQTLFNEAVQRLADSGGLMDKDSITAEIDKVISDQIESVIPSGWFGINFEKGSAYEMYKSIFEEGPLKALDELEQDYIKRGEELPEELINAKEFRNQLAILSNALHGYDVYEEIVGMGSDLPPEHIQEMTQAAEIIESPPVATLARKDEELSDNYAEYMKKLDPRILSALEEIEASNLSTDYDEYLDKVGGSVEAAKERFNTERMDAIYKIPLDVLDDAREAFDSSIPIYQSLLAQIAELEDTGAAIPPELQESIDKLKWLNILGGDNGEGWLFDSLKAGEQFGDNLIQGSVDGINAKASELEDAGVTATDDTLKAMEVIAETQSPSRRTQRLGRYLGEGLSLGISESRKGVESAASALSDDTIRRIDQIMAYMTNSFFPKWNSGWSSAMQSANSAMSNLKIPTSSNKNIPGFADGDTLTEPTLGWIAEGKHAETIIPHTDTPRSRGLLMEAAQGVGMKMGGSSSGGGISCVFNININAPSSADSSEWQQVAAETFETAKEQFLKFMREYETNKARDDYAAVPTMGLGK